MLENKKKLDPKIRFQRQNFQKQLENARGYKRQVRKSSAEAEHKTSPRVWWSIAILLVVTAGIVYAFFVPNILYIKHITIQGASSDIEPSLMLQIEAYLNQKTPFPQQNILLLSKAGLADYIKKNNSQILSVNAITKKFPNSLILNLKPRQNNFILQTTSDSYTISSDGLVTSKLQNGTTTQNSLIVIKSSVNEGIFLQSRFLKDAQLDALNFLGSNLPLAIEAPVSYYQLPNEASSSNISAVVAEGYEIRFDVKQNLQQDLQYLQLLLNQYKPEDHKNFYYIDMRFKDRGYVCVKKAPCAVASVTPISTSTPNTINP